MGRELNVKIFEDSMRLCTSNEKLMSALEKSRVGQKFYAEGDAMKEWDGTQKAGTRETQVLVSGKRSFEAAAGYRGKKVCVHNFASATNPGGGVIHGATAQEECLCRISTLYPNLKERKMWDCFYGPHRAMHNPIYNDDCIYTPGIVVFQEDCAEPTLLAEEDWYQVDVITCAAPNLREMPSNRMNPSAGSERVMLSNEELFALHLKRGRRILNIAKANGAEVVILGAFGCGAFRNPPEVVAEAYAKLMKEFDGAFETVEFAVYCNPVDMTNYEVFRRTMENRK